MTCYPKHGRPALSAGIAFFVLTSCGAAWGEAITYERASGSKSAIKTSRQAPRHQEKKLQKREIESSVGESIEVKSLVMPDGSGGNTPGGGLMPVQTAPKSISAVNADFISKQPSTSNVTALIASLPGVVFSNADPLGLSDHTGFSLRGLSYNENALFVDGTPRDDPSSHLPWAGEQADSQNVRTIRVSPGSSDITLPSYSAISGAVEVLIRNPANKFGGYLDVSYGRKALEREFLRVDTGEIGHTGIYGFVSYSNMTADEWRGSGYNRRNHVDAKFLKRWGGAEAALRITWNSMVEPTDTYPTLAQWNKYNISYNYDKNYTVGNTNWQGLHNFYRDTVRINAPIHLKATDTLSFDLNPYFTWVNSSPNGATTISNTGSYIGNVRAGILNLPYQIGGGSQWRCR